MSKNKLKYRTVTLYKSGVKRTNEVRSLRVAQINKHDFMNNEKVKISYIEYFDRECGKNGLWVSQL